MNDPRRLAGRDLLDALTTARAATLAATMDLDDAQWRVPYHRGIQPTAWDLAHIGWFAEFWLLRGPHRIGTDGNVEADGKALVFGDDAHLDSARIAHRTRWQMNLMSRGELQERLAEQLARCRQRVAAAGDDPAVLYHARFAVFHELMHVEALWWTRALLGYPAGEHRGLAPATQRGEIAVAGGEYAIGQHAGEDRFAFDNELPGRKVVLAPFRIDASPVSNTAFLAFVAAGGYRRSEFWPGRAGEWLARQQREHPERWRRTADGWQQRWFEGWRPLPPDEPVVHVTAYEAEAFCQFAGRRLPRAAEWEVAAEQMQWGQSVWEWTADAFAPYPGFRPAPYTTYSAPWFHSQRELRGGAFATHALMHDRRYRNFFLAQRTDIFGGFRTAADA
ncbi:MAG: selenoneine synthase SenA [Planctomycetota bacterium]